MYRTRRRTATGCARCNANSSRPRGLACKGRERCCRDARGISYDRARTLDSFGGVTRSRVDTAVAVGLRVKTGEVDAGGEPRTLSGSEGQNPVRETNARVKTQTPRVQDFSYGGRGSFFKISIRTSYERRKIKIAPLANMS